MKLIELDILNTVLPSSGWFIAGGAVVSRYYSDVDVFFYSEEDFKKADKLMLNSTDFVLVGKTSNANTYAYAHKVKQFLYKPSPRPVQLIKKHFGTPLKVLQTFDLSCCLKALKPTGTVVAHPWYSSELTLDPKTIRTNSFSRYIKYEDRGFTTSNKLIKSVIDEYIADSSLLPPSYEDEKPRPANEALYKSWKYFLKNRYPEMDTYLQKQTELYAPELLL